MSFCVYVTVRSVHSNFTVGITVLIVVKILTNCTIFVKLGYRLVILVITDICSIDITRK